jgi:hypothetical protein
LFRDELRAANPITGTIDAVQPTFACNPELMLRYSVTTLKSGEPAVRRALLVVCLGIMCVFLSNCGQTFELQSITVSPNAVNMNSVGATQTFTTTAFFSNTKTADLALRATFTLGKSAGGVDPAGILSVNKNVVEVTAPFCTWTATATDSGVTYSTDPFVLNITFTNNGITKATEALISVSSDGCAHP